MDELHERLDQEHTNALLKDYSADYEIWLEDRVAQLEVENERAIELLVQWITSKNTVASMGDVIVHTNRFLVKYCNCENELPPCKLCYALAEVDDDTRQM